MKTIPINEDLKQELLALRTVAQKLADALGDIQIIRRIEKPDPAWGQTAAQRALDAYEQHKKDSGWDAC